MNVQPKSGGEVPTRRLAEIIGANGSFSLGSGLVLLLGAWVFDSWFDLPAWVIAAVGASLIPYGFGLRSAASADTFDRRIAWFAAAGDLAWVFAAAVLIAVPNTMSASGKWALGAVTLAVLGFAVLQVRELRRLRG